MRVLFIRRRQTLILVLSWMLWTDLLALGATLLGCVRCHARWCGYGRAEFPTILLGRMLMSRCYRCMGMWRFLLANCRSRYSRAPRLLDLLGEFRRRLLGRCLSSRWCLIRRGVMCMVVPGKIGLTMGGFLPTL